MCVYRYLHEVTHTLLFILLIKTLEEIRGKAKKNEMKKVKNSGMQSLGATQYRLC